MSESLNNSSTSTIKLTRNNMFAAILATYILTRNDMEDKNKDKVIYSDPNPKK